MNTQNTGRIRPSSVKGNPNIPGMTDSEIPFMKGDYAKEGYRVPEHNPFGVDRRVIEENIKLKQDQKEIIDAEGINDQALLWLILLFKQGIGENLHEVEHSKMLEIFDKYKPGFSIEDLTKALDFLKANEFVTYYTSPEGNQNVVVPSERINTELLSNNGILKKAA